TMNIGVGHLKSMQAESKFDPLLLLSVSAIIMLGFVMVASAAVPVSHSIVWHQAIYVVAGVAIGLAVTFIPIDFMQRNSNSLLWLSAMLLTLILIPGVTHPVNGSMRWLFLGPISIQPSEIAKIALIFYIAGYMVRRNYQMQNTLQ